MDVVGRSRCDAEFYTGSQEIGVRGPGLQPAFLKIAV